MSLVNELQELAKTSDVVTVLRKARHAASKLGRYDIVQWITSELNGYSGIVPDYRQAVCALCYDMNRPGRAPVEFGIGYLPDYGLSPNILPVTDSISVLQEFLIKEKGGMRYPVSKEVERKVKLFLPINFRQAFFFNCVSRLEIEIIIQSVINTILDWAVKLEKEGVVGNGRTFTEEEKQKASAVQTSIDEFIKKLVSVENNTAIDPVACKSVKVKHFYQKSDWWWGFVFGTFSAWVWYYFHG